MADIRAETSRLELIVDRTPKAGQLRELGPAAWTTWDPRTAATMVGVEWPGPPSTAVVAGCVRAVERVGLRALRVDADDWVTVADVARRVGRSRETIRLWASGRMGPGGFPPPLNPGRDTTFYSWAEVASWLGPDAPVHLPDQHTVLTAVNLILQLRALMPSGSPGGCVARLVA